MAKLDQEDIELVPGSGIVKLGASGVQMLEQATVPGPAIAATEGRLWLKSDTPNTLQFTDDAGTDHQVAAGGGGGTALDANATSENLICARVNLTPTVDVAQAGQINLQSEVTASHGTTAAYATISGGYDNLVASTYSTVGGGLNNDLTSGSDYSFVGGGELNTITGASVHSFIGGGFTSAITAAAHVFIGGGELHTVGTGADWAVIAGGKSNIIAAGADYCSIVGGKDNDITNAGGNYSFIGGGINNNIAATSTSNAIVGGIGGIISGTTQECIIGGGRNNNITGGRNNVVAGGQDNDITATGTGMNTIGGGESNVISGTTQESILGGGRLNTLSAGAGNTLGGGQSNTVSATGTGMNAIGGGNTNVISGDSAYSTIFGGRAHDIISADYGVAGGRQAQINHDGVFLFADSTAADVASVEANQVLFGVANGVRISSVTEEHGFITYVDEAATTDTTVTTLRTISLNDNEAVLITANIVGMETDGSNRNAYVLRALYYRDGAGALLQGSVSRIFEEESDAAWTADISISTNDAIITVTGGAATTNVNWRSTVQCQKVG
jgi:hypothetical protein